jgi:hypothetical protein
MRDSTSRSVQQHRMRRHISEGTVFFWGVVGAIAVKLWLTSGIRIVPIWMPHDQENYVEHARTILTGQWFGHYTTFTLIKSPFYPIYLAFVQETGFTLPLANLVLYAAACLIACIAVRPLIRSGVILSGIFVVLFFNPMTYASLAWLTMRSELNDSLALMVTACALAILVRRRATFRTLVKWWVGLGASFAAFWLTREEAVWLVPCLFVIVLAYLWSIRKEPYFQLKLFGLVIPFAIWNLSVATIGKINENTYGWNTVVEPKAPEFVSAYNSFARIIPVKEEYRISVPRSSREIAYSVSPAARELEPSLEGANGRAWIALVCQYGVHICDDIAGSFFVWAFRDAVGAAGHYSSGRDARDFYLRLASEVDSACDSGKIRCRRKALTIFPNPTWSQVPEIASTFRDAVWYETAFAQFSLGHVVDIVPNAVLDEQYAFVVRSITYDNRDDQGFQGWLATDRPMTITIEDSNGVKQVEGYLRQPSADVAAALAQGGRAKWDDQDARFAITTNCRSGCFIVATDSQHHQTRIALASSTPDFTSSHVVYHLDGIQDSAYVNADNGTKLTILGDIALAYQLVVPYWVLACAALLVLRGVRALIRRRVIAPSRQDVLSIAVIASGAALMLILSILTASYSAGLNPEYLGSFTPLMLLALSVATSLEGLVAYRLVRLRLRATALQPALVRTE